MNNWRETVSAATEILILIGVALGCCAAAGVSVVFWRIAVAMQ